MVTRPSSPDAEAPLDTAHVLMEIAPSAISTAPRFRRSTGRRWEAVMS
jgi:hypothetical protein